MCQTHKNQTTSTHLSLGKNTNCAELSTKKDAGEDVQMLRDAGHICILFANY